MTGISKLYYELCSNFNLKEGYSAEDLLKLLKGFNITLTVDIPINKCIDKFITNKKVIGLSNNTINSYVCSLKRFNLWCSENNQSLNYFNKEIFNKYIIYLKNKNLKQSSISYNINVIKIFMSWLESEQIIQSNLIKNFKFSNKKSHRDALSKTSISKIKKACKSIQEKALINFMLDTGCRVSELINIKIDDIDFSQNQVKVTGKGDKQRIVLFTNKTKNILKLSLKQSYNKQYLFSASVYPYQKLQRFAINAKIKKLAKRANINQNISPHSFRHTFATIALEKGLDLVSIQKLLGHENLSTTQIYTNIDIKSIKVNYNKIFK